MVRIKTKVGPKGQIVIPKVLRDEYNIFPGDEVIIEENNQTLILEKPKEDIVKKLEAFAKKIRFEGKINIHAIEEEYEERWKKAQHST
ncbi:AbrB/MazE/SpoVT family DNA-binding domain-containing protein [Candidatus Woesearchaeota archaeon]|nr:AbrB/MazE/SpoVT family DNA-binding domain-containing protein [Candidatus Woesearchaeota archaeon]